MFRSFSFIQINVEKNYVYLPVKQLSIKLEFYRGNE
jgi:hypothetical protein